MNKEPPLLCGRRLTNTADINTQAKPEMEFTVLGACYHMLSIINSNSTPQCPHPSIQTWCVWMTQEIANVAQRTNMQPPSFICSSTVVGPNASAPSTCGEEMALGHSHSYLEYVRNPIKAARSVFLIGDCHFSRDVRYGSSHHPRKLDLNSFRDLLTDSHIKPAICFKKCSSI